jgi:hypothetical protein
MSERGDLITFRGASDGLALNGTMNLTAALLYAAVTSIRIPRGGILKVCGWRISGAQATIDINHKKTLAGAAVPVSTTSYNPTLDSSIHVEKRKPIVIPSITGEESVTISWTQGVAALTYIDVDIEIVTPA